MKLVNIDESYIKTMREGYILVRNENVNTPMKVVDGKLYTVDGKSPLTLSRVPDKQLFIIVQGRLSELSSDDIANEFNICNFKIFNI